MTRAGLGDGEARRRHSRGAKGQEVHVCDESPKLVDEYGEKRGQHEDKQPCLATEESVCADEHNDCGNVSGQVKAG